MKKIIPYILILTFVSCQKNIQISDEIASAKAITTIEHETQTYGHIGDPNKTPDLYIPELEFDWQFRSEGLGLRSHGIYPVFTDQEGDTVLRYSCWIANGAPVDYSGKNDFVVCRSCDGIKDTTGYDSYNFPGVLSIVTFQDGLPIGETIKQRFFVANTDVKNGVVWSRLKQYGQDTMFISAGAADEYLNRAEVRAGKNVIVVTVNPDGAITETNTDNNVSTLPVVVNALSGTGGRFDLSAIDENKTHPATEFTAVYLGRIKGKNTIKLDWECPYHEPIYVKHWFTVKRDGAIIADHVENSNYTDVFNGNFKSTTYEVAITVPGLGQSEFKSILVTKN